MLLFCFSLLFSQKSLSLYAHIVLSLYILLHIQIIQIPRPPSLGLNVIRSMTLHEVWKFAKNKKNKIKWINRYEIWINNCKERMISAHCVNMNVFPGLNRRRRKRSKKWRLVLTQVTHLVWYDFLFNYFFLIYSSIRLCSIYFLHFMVCVIRAGMQVKGSLQLNMVLHGLTMTQS